MPAGNTGGDGGYPFENGYGHEEWNFQAEDALNGYVYGYLYYRPSALRLGEEGGRMKIAFWTKHPDGTKLLVGFYHECVLADDTERQELDGHFKRNGIYGRRAGELVAAVPRLTLETAYAELIAAVEQYDLRFKCRIDNIEALPPMDWRVVPPEIAGKAVGQYFTNPTIISSDGMTSLLTLPRIAGTDGSPLSEEAYFREVGPTSRLVKRLHSQLSNRLALWLRERGVMLVDQELDRVDVEFSIGSSNYRAELKTCHGVGTTRSIREALGQLLEYNYYRGRQPAKHWLIVLDAAPSDDDRQFIDKLRSIRLPLNLGWQVQEQFEFSYPIFE